MVLQDVRAANVKALTDGALLALHRDDFNALLGSLTHIRHMWRFEALRKVCARPCISKLCRDSVSPQIESEMISNNARLHADYLLPGHCSEAPLMPD